MIFTVPIYVWMAHFRRNTIYCKLKISLVHIAWMGGRGKSTSSCLKYLRSQIGCWVGGSELIETCLLNMQFFHFEGFPKQTKYFVLAGLMKYALRIMNWMRELRAEDLRESANWELRDCWESAERLLFHSICAGFWDPITLPISRVFGEL